MYSTRFPFSDRASATSGAMRPRSATSAPMRSRFIISEVLLASEGPEAAAVLALGVETFQSPSAPRFANSTGTLPWLAVTYLSTQPGMLEKSIVVNFARDVRGARGVVVG